MMNLEFEKKKLERRKVETAKHEMEFRILEKMEEIERIKKNIEVQEARIKELDIELADKE